MLPNNFYATWLECLETIPELRRYNAVGISPSYPLFAQANGVLLVRHFYHTAQLLGPEILWYGIPRILATLRYEDLGLIEVKSEPDFGIPPFEDATYGLSPAELQLKRTAMPLLEQAYDALFQAYPQPPDKELAADFLNTLKTVVPPLLWPYYEVMAQDFMAWVEK